MEVERIVKEIMREKKIKKIEPTHAMRMEIAERYPGSLEQLDGELKFLCSNYTLLEHPTINSKAYTLSGL